MPRAARRFAFWGAVVSVAALTPFATQLVADQFPQSGFSKLVNYSHKGAS